MTVDWDENYLETYIPAEVVMHTFNFSWRNVDSPKCWKLLRSIEENNIPQSVNIYNTNHPGDSWIMIWSDRDKDQKNYGYAGTSLIIMPGEVIYDFQYVNYFYVCLDISVSASIQRLN